MKRVHVQRPDQRSHTYSARQRMMVITFDTVEDAEAWDRAGQPADALWDALIVAAAYADTDEEVREELRTRLHTTDVQSSPTSG